MRVSPPPGENPAFGLRTCVALSFIVLAPSVVLAQTPWTVTITPTMNPLPVGFCAAVQVNIRDASGVEIPRNPQGQRITLADFDMSVESNGVTSVVGKQVDASHWSVCGCQGAAPGTAATINASYPARLLSASARVAGVDVKATARVELAAAKGDINPPGCPAPAMRAELAAAARALQPARVAVAVPPVSTPVTAAPTSIPTVSGPVGEVAPKRVAPYQPGPMSLNLDLTANGSWVMPGPMTLSLDLIANGTWYEAAPLTFTIDLSATGTWAGIAKPPGEIKRTRE